MRLSRFYWALLGCAWLLSAAAAQADPVRLHGEAAAAHAVTGYQKDEFGWGASGIAAAELPFGNVLGVQLELSTLWLSQGSRPSDPRFARGGAASDNSAAVGFRVRPFGSQHHGQFYSPSGLWLATDLGVSITNGLTRAMFDAQLGYDFLDHKGREGIGPMVALIHVQQPDSALRPEDANIVLVGVHVMYDFGPGLNPNSDRDHDGILDDVDACPDVPEDKDGFEDTDGCPDLDNDKDGIDDHDDKCPNAAEDKDGFEDQDGCPDPDNDKDGIPDAQDLCPNEPETVNGYADTDGCPDEDQVRVVGDKIVLDDRVHFYVNSFVIRKISYPLLMRLGKLIADHPEYTHVSVEGHADERGPDNFNQKLSEDRARAVMEFLVKQGIKQDRLSSMGFGSSKPLVDKKSEYALLLNRRVEFTVTRQLKPDGSAVVSAPTQTPTAPLPPPPPNPDDEEPPLPQDRANTPKAGEK